MKKLKEFDNKIGELIFDEYGNPYRFINGEKIYQIKDDKDGMNEIINRVRASGRSSWDLLKAGYSNR